MTNNSFTPDLTKFCASAITEPIGRDTKSPRMDGIIQKVQRWLQPSEILT